MNSIESHELLMRDMSLPEKNMVGIQASPKLKLSLKHPEVPRLKVVRSTPSLEAASMLEGGHV